MSRNRVKPSDRERVAAFIERHWHDRKVMSRGRVFFPHEEEGFMEERDGDIVGLLTFYINSDEMEVLTLNSTLEGAGIGSSLMLNAIETARKKDCTRVTLTTTNDNLRAIGFYQRLGFRMVTVNLGVVDEARKIKPTIPEFGERGVRIQDEVVMELEVEPFLVNHGHD